MTRRIVDQLINLIHSPSDARSELDTFLCSGNIGFEFRPKVAPSFLNMAAPTHRLNELFGAKRNQHADDDDSDLARECAPAVQRLGQMDVNGTAPPDGKLRSFGQNCQRPQWLES